MALRNPREMVDPDLGKYVVFRTRRYWFDVLILAVLVAIAARIVIATPRDGNWLLASVLTSSVLPIGVFFVVQRWLTSLWVGERGLRYVRPLRRPLDLTWDRVAGCELESQGTESLVLSLRSQGSDGGQPTKLRIATAVRRYSRYGVFLSEVDRFSATGYVICELITTRCTAFRTVRPAMVGPGEETQKSAT
jgi:hypothetical protein